MPTLFEPTTPLPFAGPLADLPNQFLEASTRVLSASADLYTELLRSQADAAAGLLEAYVAVGRQTASTGREVAETADEATTKVVEGSARATQRATKRTARATRKAAAKPARAAAAAPKAAARAAAKAAPVQAPVTGYDDLTAEQLVAKLPELSQAELAQVTAYERAHEARTTVLDRVKALTGPEPAPGYDELTADDAQKLVTGGDAELAAAVRDYERRHKNRSSVVDAAVRHADAS
jgi:hypothetical protein